MKGRKSGGMDSPATGVKEYDQDFSSKPERRVNAPKIEGAAEERKRGGRTKKHVGDVGGEAAKMRADRKPRKSGGRAYSDSNPFTSASKGTPPKGRKLSMEMDGTD